MTFGNDILIYLETISDRIQGTLEVLGIESRSAKQNALSLGSRCESSSFHM